MPPTTPSTPGASSWPPCSPPLSKVLFKRKPVQFLQPPPVENDHEVCPFAPTPHPTTRRTALTRAQCSLANSCHRCGTYPRQARFLSRTRTILIGMSLSNTHSDALGANTRPRLDFYKQVSRAANHAGPTTTPLTTPIETLHMSNHRPLRPELLRGTRVRSKVFRPLLRVSTR